MLLRTEDTGTVSRAFPLVSGEKGDPENAVDTFYSTLLNGLSCFKFV